jgi:hypothetical protein
MKLFVLLLMATGLVIVILESVEAPAMLRNLFRLRKQWRDEEREENIDAK